MHCLLHKECEEIKIRTDYKTWKERVLSVSHEHLLIVFLSAHSLRSMTVEYQLTFVELL